MNLKHSTFAAAIALGCCANTAWAVGQYALTNLSDPPNVNAQTLATGINSRGQVVVRSIYTDGSSHGVLWSPVASNSTIGTFTDIGDLPGGADSCLPYGINDFGQIVGHSNGEIGGHAFLWQPSVPNGTSGTMHDLGDLPGGVSASIAFRINVYGDVFGVGRTDDGQHYFNWHPDDPNGVSGSMADFLPNLGDASLQSSNSYGQIIGSRPGSPFGFLWTPTVPNGTTGSMVNIMSPKPPDTSGTSALGINSMGQVVGTDGDANDHFFALLWTPSTPNGNSGTSVRFEFQESPTSINSYGVFVGYLGKSYSVTNAFVG